MRICEKHLCNLRTFYDYGFSPKDINEIGKVRCLGEASQKFACGHSEIPAGPHSAYNTNPPGPESEEPTQPPGELTRTFSSKKTRHTEPELEP